MGKIKNSNSKGYLVALVSKKGDMIYANSFWFPKDGKLTVKAIGDLMNSDEVRNKLGDNPVILSITPLEED